MNRRIGASFGAMVASAAAVVVLTAAPAFADPFDTTLGPTNPPVSPAVTGQCDTTTDPGVVTCRLRDPDGIRSVHVKNTETNVLQTYFSDLCDSSNEVDMNISLPAGTRYKIFVRDCHGNKSTFTLRPNGFAVRNNPA